MGDTPVHSHRAPPYTALAQAWPLGRTGNSWQGDPGASSALSGFLVELDSNQDPVTPESGVHDLCHAEGYSISCLSRKPAQ